MGGPSLNALLAILYPMGGGGLRRPYSAENPKKFKTTKMLPFEHLELSPFNPRPNLNPPLNSYGKLRGI